ncbi:PAS domain S-box protein [Limisalsivibrio acetivorans]|uniref:PAS domain S-box protein n=1 Tax=Limisalsivibrio acetivorans TaxID=1304888 RepID=UPI0003B6028C|nr:PAS domain S-box protein [Limisalsivibrio acetivorans]
MKRYLRRILERGLSGKLTIIIFMLGISAAILLSVVSFYIEYNDVKEESVKELTRIKDSQIPVLAEALWKLDYELVVKASESILTSEDYITGLKLFHDGNPYIHLGKLTKYGSVRTFNVATEIFEGEREIGTLDIYVDLNKVIMPVLERTLRWFFVEVIMIFVLCSLIYFAVKKIVVDDLEEISRQLKDFDPQKDLGKRVKRRQTLHDELSDFVVSFNELLSRYSAILEKNTSLNEELRERNILFETVMESVPVGIAVMDSEGIVKRIWNRGAEEMTGWKREEVLESFIPMIEQTENRMALFRERMKSIIRGGESFEFEGEHLRKGGEVFYTKVYSSPVELQGDRCIVTVFADITEEKQLRRQNSRKAEILKLINENTLDVIYAVSIDGEVAYCNKAFRKIYSSNERDASPGITASYVHPEDVEKVEKWKRDAFYTTFTEGRFRTEDSMGSVRWIEGRWRPLLGEGGALIGIQGREHDITESVEAENELVETEMFFSNMIEHAPVLIFMLDRNLRIVDANIAALDFAGYSRGDLQGFDFARTLFRGEEAEKIRNILTPDATRFTRRVETTFNIRDDWKMDAEILASAVYRDGIHNGYVVFGVDMSEVQVMQDTMVSIQQSFESLSIEFKSVLDAVADSIIYVDLNMRIQWAKISSTVSFEKKDADALTNEYCYKALFNLDSPCRDCACVDVLKSGESTQRRLTTPSGRTMDVHAVPVFDARGVLKGSVEVLNDITERLKMEAELADKHYFSQMAELAAGAAHDIKNPMQAIQHSSQNISCFLDDLEIFLRELPEEYMDEVISAFKIPKAVSMAKDGTRNIIFNSDRINETVVDMLASYAPDQKQELINPETLIRQSVEMLRHKIKDKCHNFRVNYKNMNTWISVDKGKIRRALMNIISNSLEALPDRSCGVYVSVYEDVTDNSVVISVSDEGVGIAEEDQEKVFSYYYSTKDKQGRSGIGLYLCKRFVRENGGTIGFNSVQGDGTTFYLKFPRESTNLKVYKSEGVT